MATSSHHRLLLQLSILLGLLANCGSHRRQPRPRRRLVKRPCAQTRHHAVHHIVRIPNRAHPALQTDLGLHFQYHLRRASFVAPNNLRRLFLWLICSSTSITMGDSAEEWLKKGAEVEVSFEDVGFRGSWYTATVLRTVSKKNNKLFVEFHNLMADGRGSKPLREFVNVILDLC